MNKIIVGLIIVAFSVISCKKTPVLSQDQTATIKTSIQFQPSYIDFIYMTTKTKLEYSDGNSADQYALSLRVKKDSVIWASVGKAGVEGVRGLLRPDSLFVIDKMKNDSYSYDLNYLQTIIQSNLSYSNIQNLLVGDLLFPYEVQDDVIKNETHYILTQKKGNFRIESFVRFDNMKVERANIIDSISMSKTTVTYSLFIVADSILVPSVCALDIEYKKEGKKMQTQLILSHSKVEFTTKPLNFPFTVPKKYNEK